MPTFLPPLASTQDFSRLLAWFNYLWACYQALLGNYHALLGNYHALLGNYHALKAENAQLRERAAEAEKRAAHAEEHSAELHNYAKHAQHLQENADLRADKAEKYAFEMEVYANKLELELAALGAEEKARYEVMHELKYDEDGKGGKWTKFVDSQTKAVLKAQKELKNYKRSMDKFVEQIVGLLQPNLFDLITQRSSLEFPVIVISSSEQDDPIFMNRGDAQNAKFLSGNKFPMGQGSTIKKIVECASLKNMVKSMREVLKLCDCDLSE
jgi:hypothetical protein